MEVQFIRYLQKNKTIHLLSLLLLILIIYYDKNHALNYIFLSVEAYLYIFSYDMVISRSVTNYDSSSDHIYTNAIRKRNYEFIGVRLFIAFIFLMYILADILPNVSSLFVWLFILVPMVYFHQFYQFKVLFDFSYFCPPLEGCFRILMIAFPCIFCGSRDSRILVSGILFFLLVSMHKIRRLVRTSYYRTTHNIKDIEENQYDKIVLYFIFFLSSYNNIPMFLYFIIANFLTRKVFFRVNFGGEGEERITMWGLPWPCDALISPMDFGVIYISFALSVISIVFYD